MITRTTDTVASRERVEYWTDLVSRFVTPMRIEPGQESFRGAVRAQAIADVHVSEVSGSGIHALHTGTEVARTSGHLYGAALVLEGHARIGRRGERIDLQPGDVFITDSRHEYALDLDRPWRNLVLSLPANWIDSRIDRPERVGGTVVRRNPLARLWSTHLATGFAIANSFSPAAASLFVRHSVELLAQVLEETQRDQPIGSDAARSALFLNACHVIALELGDPDLGPARIARRLHISTRSLARVFAAHDTTVMQRVFDERIRQAMKLLASPQSAHRSITEIAFACGFGDSSHFGRVFAARVAMTPSEWRRRNQ